MDTPTFTNRMLPLAAPLYRMAKSILLTTIACLFLSSNRNGEIEYYQVSWEISRAETEEREFKPLESVKDNYPKFLLTTESFPQSRAGIIHNNVFKWLLEKEL